MEQKVNTKFEFDFIDALTFAVQYAEKNHRGFTCEEIAAEYYKTHNPPSEPRVWGKIIGRMKEMEIIKKHGHKDGKSVTTGKSKIYNVWISMIYSRKQAAKRKLDSEPIDTGQIKLL